MITWSATALARLGMTVAEAEPLVALTVTDEEFPTKEHARLAWEEHEPATFSVPGSSVIYLSFPAQQHIECYAEQVKALGL